MRKRTAFWFIVSLVVAVLGTGCSRGSLDRKSAAKAIQERFNDDISGLMVQVGRIGPLCMAEEDGKQVPEDLTPEKHVEIVAARAAGFLSVSADGPNYWQLSLTDKGKSAPNMERLRVHDYHNTLNGCDYRTVMLALASMEVVQVTGISGDEQKSTGVRMVDFQWRWKPTELGEMLRENGSIYQKLTPEQRKELKNSVFNPTDITRVEIPVPSDDAINTAHLPFKKFDDGWRLQAPPKIGEKH